MHNTTCILRCCTECITYIYYIAYACAHSSCDTLRMCLLDLVLLAVCTCWLSIHKVGPETRRPMGHGTTLVSNRATSYMYYMINKLQDTFQIYKAINTTQFKRKTFSDKNQLPQVGLRPTTLLSRLSALLTELLREHSWLGQISNQGKARQGKASQSNSTWLTDELNWGEGRGNRQRCPTPNEVYTCMYM